MSLAYPPPYQDLRTLAEHICTGESTIENWVRLGQFPAPRKIGGKRLWKWKDIERHLAGDGDTVAASTDRLAEAITNATRAAASRQD
jgi:predicted DNA-binding transcriptional regulator AlpA